MKFFVRCFLIILMLNGGYLSEGDLEKLKDTLDRLGPNSPQAERGSRNVTDCDPIRVRCASAYVFNWMDLDRFSSRHSKVTQPLGRRV